MEERNLMLINNFKSILLNNNAKIGKKNRFLVGKLL